MTYQEIEQARITARESIAKVDAEVSAMVRLCAGRLRAATGSERGWSSTAGALKKLKDELRDFDGRSRRWK